MQTTFFRLLQHDDKAAGPSSFSVGRLGRAVLQEPIAERQYNIKSVRSLAEPLQVAMDNGARRALVPLENKRNFLDVSGDIVERVDPVFFSDPMTAAMKALGMT